MIWQLIPSIVLALETERERESEMDEKERGNKLYQNSCTARIEQRNFPGTGLKQLSHVPEQLGQNGDIFWTPLFVSVSCT